MVEAMVDADVLVGRPTIKQTTVGPMREKNVGEP
jgi:hypothetical protein